MVAHRGNPDLKLSDPIWLAAFRINERKVKDYSRGRVFLAGDAAHIHSPAGGQGMNTGIQDAVSLADPLMDAQGGDLTLLRAWADRRKAVARSVVRMTDRMTRAATLHSPLARVARNAVLEGVGCIPSIRMAMARRIAGLGY